MTRAQGTYERTSRKTDWSRTGRDPHGFRTCTNARKRTTTVRVLNYDTLSWNSSLLMYLQELWTCSKLSVEWMNFISLPINWTYLKNKKRTKNKCKRRHAFRKCCHLFDELLSMRCNQTLSTTHIDETCKNNTCAFTQSFFEQVYVNFVNPSTFINIILKMFKKLQRNWHLYMTLISNSVLIDTGKKPFLKISSFSSLLTGTFCQIKKIQETTFTVDRHQSRSTRMW